MKLPEIASIDTNAFIPMRQSFDAILQSTIEAMDKKNYAEAAITLKLNLELIPRKMDLGCGDEPLLEPAFSYSVQNLIKTQAKTEGVMRDFGMIRKNHMTGLYQFLDIIDQESLYDAEGEGD